MTTLIRALLPTSTVISARNRWIRVCASIPTTRATSRIQQTTPTNGDLSTRLAELCPNRGLHTATTTAKSSASPTRRAFVTDVTTADGVGHQTIQRSGRAPSQCVAASHLNSRKTGTTVEPVETSTFSTAVPTALIASGAGLYPKASILRAPLAVASQERSRSTSGAGSVVD